MRVLPMLRGMIGAATIIVWALVLSDPGLYKVRNHSVDEPHPDVPGAAQPNSRNVPSRLAEGNDRRFSPDDRAALSKPNELGSMPKPFAANDPGTAALSEASHRMDLAAPTSHEAQRENSGPEIGEVAKPPPPAAVPPARSSATSSAAAHQAEIAAGPSPSEAIATPRNSPQSGPEAGTPLPVHPDTAQIPVQTSPQPSSPDTPSADSAFTNAARSDKAMIASVLPEATISPSNPRDSGDRKANAPAASTEVSRSQPASSTLPPVPDFWDDARLSFDTERGHEASPVSPSFSESPSTPSNTVKPWRSESDFGSSQTIGANAANSVEPPPTLVAPFPPNAFQALREFSTPNMTTTHPKPPTARVGVSQSKRIENARLASHPMKAKSTIDREARKRAPSVASRRDAARQSGKADSYRVVTSPVGESHPHSAPATQVSATMMPGAQWRLALRRRCPSIVASAVEYDDDLVQLCRRSAGL